MNNPSYATWAVGECMSKGEADYRLVMFALWSIREGHVVNPAEDKPELLKQGASQMGPLSLPVLLDTAPGGATQDLTLNLKGYPDKEAVTKEGKDNMSRAELLRRLGVAAASGRPDLAGPDRGCQEDSEASRSRAQPGHL